jgi:polyhydroxyalkanoate synthase subunit PhaC
MVVNICTNLFMEKMIESHPPSNAFISASLAKLTQGRSIASTTVIASYLDWLIHLSKSPDKQLALLKSAVHEYSALCRYIQSANTGNCEACILASSPDKRFKHDGWNSIPYNWFSQSFLSTERWWRDAMSGVRGVTDHHEHVVGFMTRQLLDMLSPSNCWWLNPEVVEQIVDTGGANLRQGAQNYMDDFLKMMNSQKPPQSEFVPGKDVAITPGQVIYRNRLMELIQYGATTSTVFPEPILITPSWIMKYYILDLSPQNSLVKYLVDSGHTVFIISWKNPTSEDRDLAMADYLNLGVLAAIEQIEKIYPKRKIHAAGYCLGGTLLAIAASLLARRRNNPLATMTLLASLIDFEDPGEISLFIDENQISQLEDIMSQQGYLDGSQMAGAFTLINSIDLVWSRMIHDYLIGARKKMTDLQSWNADRTRLPYRMHSEYLRQFYLRNDFAEGRYKVEGEPILLKDSRLPMFVVSTELDHVSPWRSVYKTKLLTDCELTFVLSSGGHNVGVVNPPLTAGMKSSYPISYKMHTSQAHDHYVNASDWLSLSQHYEGSWWPAWQAWLAARSGKPQSEGSKRKQVTSLTESPGTYVHES